MKLSKRGILSSWTIHSTGSCINSPYIMVSLGKFCSYGENTYL